MPTYETVEACWAAFDRLHEGLNGGQTKLRIHLAVSNWYAHLVRPKWAAGNPADGLDEEFDWSSDTDDADTPCLATEQVRALYQAADGPEDRLLVLALSTWGLRLNEVARIHTRQFVLDVTSDEVPSIEFEERKNGPGQVSLLYGRYVLEDRLATVADPPPLESEHTRMGPRVVDEDSETLVYPVDHGAYYQTTSRTGSSCSRHAGRR